jgi:hypothetical protein
MYTIHTSLRGVLSPMCWVGKFENPANAITCADRDVERPPTELDGISLRGIFRGLQIIGKASKVALLI